MAIALAAVLLALGCSTDSASSDGGSDAGGVLDGGATDSSVVPDGADGIDAGPEDGGDQSDAADPPLDGAVDDGSMPDPPAGPCARWERDVDGDGDVDTAIAFVYDVDGRLVTEERDTESSPGLLDGADGTPDYRQTTRYDDEGNVASISDDWDADGNDDLLTRYDAGGRKVEEVWDVQDDGSVLDRTTYSYREDGEISAKERDGNGDGDVDSSTVYVYDGDGSLLRIEEDGDLSDELIDNVSTYTYDDQGHRTQEDIYEGETPASRTVWTYDVEGNLILREEDVDLDAQLDTIEQWTYEDGVLAAHDIDDDGDGLVDQRLRFDAAGKVLTDESYHDGVLDVSTMYEHDGEGNVLVERVVDGEGALLSLKQYAYGESSLLTELEVDTDGDGIDDVVTRYRYDSDGRLLAVEEKRGTDPEAPFIRIEDYAYDDEGRLLETTFDGDADGIPDGFERRLYEC